MWDGGEGPQGPQVGEWFDAIGRGASDGWDASVGGSVRGGDQLQYR